MRTRTRTVQKMPAEYEAKILEVHKFVIGARKNTCFELSQIGSMDAVPLTFDVPSNRTVDNIWSREDSLHRCFSMLRRWHKTASSVDSQEENADK
jgi:hypothetical protein